MAKSARDVNGELGEFAVTNWTSDLSLNCNEAFAEAGFLALQDNVGTLIKILIEKGIISGSVTA